MRGTQMDFESSIGDYKEVEGLMFPHSIDSGAKGSPQRQKITIWDGVENALALKHIKSMEPGDQVIIYTQQRQYVYVVDRTAVVEPTAVEVMASTGSPTVTLISCYPYLVDKQRIVVFARLQN